MGSYGVVEVLWRTLLVLRNAFVFLERTFRTFGDSRGRGDTWVLWGTLRERLWGSFRSYVVLLVNNLVDNLNHLSHIQY